MNIQHECFTILWQNIYLNKSDCRLSNTLNTIPGMLNVLHPGDFTVDVRSLLCVWHRCVPVEHFPGSCWDKIKGLVHQYHCNCRCGGSRFTCVTDVRRRSEGEGGTVVRHLHVWISIWGFDQTRHLAGKCLDPPRSPCERVGSAPSRLVWLGIKAGLRNARFDWNWEHLCDRFTQKSSPQVWVSTLCLN